METAFLSGLNEDGFFGWVEWERLFRLGWMGTAFLSGLNGNGFFIWVEWERLFYLGWMKTAFSYELQMGDQRRWVVNADGWSTQMGGQRRWVVNAARWSTQRLVGAAGWSAQLGGNRPFFEVWARLQQMLARIETNGMSFYLIRLAGVNLTEGWCRGNRRWCQRIREWCQNITILIKMIKIIKTRKKFKINRRNLYRTNSNESRRDH
jgi:hypothetical protein